MREQQRRTIRGSFEGFCRHALAPRQLVPQRHHLLIIRALEDVARQMQAGKTVRQMIFMPPGSAKSTYASQLYAAWLLAQAPGLSVIGASNTDKLATSVSRKVQGYARDCELELGYRLTSESTELWYTSNGGQYLAAGVGSVITGFRADMAIIDDPVKSREQADSLVLRDKTWEWFEADLTSRCRPGACIVVIQTRWHMDDLSGRLLERQGDRWRVLSLPATALDDDPLGRQPGEMLWADDPDYKYGELLAERKAHAEAEGASRNWSALYEQNPIPREGALFKIVHIGVLDAAGPGETVRAWDLAATKQVGSHSPDWTVGVRLTRTKDKSFVVDDVVRLRGGPDEVEAAIVATAARDGHGVRIGLPQDPGQAGKSQVLYLTRKLAGYRVQSSPETGDKATRAAPVASQCNIGNLAMVRGNWNTAFLDELSGFPAAKHDDCVDSLSRAFSMLISLPPMQINMEALKRI